MPATRKKLGTMRFVSERINVVEKDDIGLSRPEFIDVPVRALVINAIGFMKAEFDKHNVRVTHVVMGWEEYCELRAWALQGGMDLTAEDEGNVTTEVHDLQVLVNPASRTGMLFGYEPTDFTILDRGVRADLQQKMMMLNNALSAAIYRRRG